MIQTTYKNTIQSLLWREGLVHISLHRLAMFWGHPKHPTPTLNMYQSLPEFDMWLCIMTLWCCRTILVCEWIIINKLCYPTKIFIMLSDNSDNYNVVGPMNVRRWGWGCPAWSLVDLARLRMTMIHMQQQQQQLLLLLLLLTINILLLLLLLLLLLIITIIMMYTSLSPCPRWPAALEGVYGGVLCIGLWRVVYIYYGRGDLLHGKGFMKIRRQMIDLYALSYLSLSVHIYIYIYIYIRYPRWPAALEGVYEGPG